MDKNCDNCDYASSAPVAPPCPMWENCLSNEHCYHLPTYTNRLVGWLKRIFWR